MPSVCVPDGGGGKGQVVHPAAAVARGWLDWAAGQNQSKAPGGESVGGQGVWGDSILWGESWDGADLSATALIGDPDALTQGPLSFLRP